MRSWRTSRTGRRSAFSLIEVLTVVLLLTVLLLAALPAFRAARVNAQRHTAASDAMELAGAALEFRRVYGSWPCEEEAGTSDTVITAGKSGTGLDAYSLDIAKVVHTLLGDESCRRYNPRSIAFLELTRGCLRQKAGDAVAYPYDPWGRPYVMLMARTTRLEGRLSSNVNRIEGGLAIDLHGAEGDVTVETPDDIAVFSWGDPSMATNSTAPTRIVGSWSPR